MLEWNHPRELVVTPFEWWGYAGWALIALSYVVAIRKKRTEFGLFCIALGLHVVLLDVVMYEHGYTGAISPLIVTREQMALRHMRALLTAPIIPLFLAGPAIYLNIRRSDVHTARRRLLGAYFALADVLLLIICLCPW